MDNTKLCRKILFLQTCITTLFIKKYTYNQLVKFNKQELERLYKKFCQVRQRELSSIDREKIKENMENILDQLANTRYLEKYKCFIFRGEYETTPIIELVEYEDEELWNYMIPKDLENMFGIYNVYILNVLRYTLYKLHKDGFDSIRTMLRNEKAFDMYCEISYTLSVNFFYNLLKIQEINIVHCAFTYMKKDIIEDFDKYVESNGVIPE